MKNNLDSSKLDIKDLMKKMVKLLPSEKGTQNEFEEAMNFPNGLYNYLERLFPILRKDHNLISKILFHCSTDEEKQIIAKYFSTILNSNIFSKTKLQDEYLLILTRILEYELSSEPSINEFLSEKSICTYFLSDLYELNEIRNYFIQILQPCLSEIANWKSQISFDLKNFTEKEEEKEKDIVPSTVSHRNLPSSLSSSIERHSRNIVDLNDNKEDDMDLMDCNNNNDNDNIIESDNKQKETISKDQLLHTYLSVLDVDLLNTYLQKETSPNAKLYIEKHINIEEKDEDKLKFANKLSENLKIDDVKEKLSPKIEKCINILDKIFHNMIKYVDLIPSSIKSILKIMQILLQKQFKSIDNVTLYGYLSCFFINILMHSMLMNNPEETGLIESTLFSESIKNNINLFMKIIIQFCKGEMFHSSNENCLTVFNIYFIRNYHLISSFYESILQQTKVPSIVEEFILNNKNNENDNSNFIYDYEYDFFKRNQREYIRGIINIYDTKLMKNLVTVVNKNKNDFVNYSNILKKKNETTKHVDLFLTCIDRCPIDLMEELNNNLNNDANHNSNHKTNHNVNNNPNNDLKKYHFYGEYIEEYSPIFKKIKKLTETPLTIPLLKVKEGQNEKEINTNKVISAKNCLCKFLYNVSSLEHNCFALNINEQQTQKVIELLKNINIINSTNSKIANEIIWCVDTFNQIIKSLPTEYTENDYSRLYNELLTDITNERNELKSYYDIISSLHETVFHVNKFREKINFLCNCQKENKIMEQVKRFIYDDRSYSYTIEPKKKKPLISFKMDYKNNNKGKTLSAFCDDFLKMNLLQPNSDLFKSLESLSVKEIIKTCFTHIKKAIIEKYFSYDLRNLIERRVMYVNQDEISFYDGEQKTKLVSERIMKEDKEIRERFLKECGYSKKKIKQEQFFCFFDIPLINKIYDILKEYVMNRLYDALFPNEPTEKDFTLHEKFKALSPMCKPSSISKDLLPYENIIIASVPKAKKYIKQFENERTPLSKKKAFQKFMELIKDIITYVTSDNSGIFAVDDTTPLLIYFLIKASPEKYQSNVSYLELFMDLFEQQGESNSSTLNGPIILMEKVDVDLFTTIKHQNVFDTTLEGAFTGKKIDIDVNMPNNY